MKRPWSSRFTVSCGRTDDIAIVVHTSCERISRDDEVRDATAHSLALQPACVEHCGIRKNNNFSVQLYSVRNTGGTASTEQRCMLMGKQMPLDQELYAPRLKCEE